MDKSKEKAIDYIDREADEYWFKDFKKEYPSLNIENEYKKNIIRWCYKKHIEEEIEWRKQMTELKLKVKQETAKEIFKEIENKIEELRKRRESESRRIYDDIYSFDIAIEILEKLKEELKQKFVKEDKK